MSASSEVARLSRHCALNPHLPVSEALTVLIAIYEADNPEDVASAADDLMSAAGRIYDEAQGELMAAEQALDDAHRRQESRPGLFR